MHRKMSWIILSTIVALAALVGLNDGLRTSGVAAQGQDSSSRRVNAPYVSGSANIPASRQAVFWFGQVTPTSNHVNARVAYNDERLQVTLHIFDQYLWYDGTPSAPEFADWDSATLYIDLNGNSGTAPDGQSYRLDAQLNHFQERSSYEKTYVGNGAGWERSNVPFNSQSNWRGSALNSDAAARGWWIRYEIPFSSLGLAGRPDSGTEWGIALAIHDRDDQAGTPIPDSWWPEGADELQPDSWAILHFGIPQHTPPVSSAGNWVTVRHGLEGAEVPDAHVGGHSVCGGPYAPEYFPGWGSANYAGYDQINVQNQWDVADWPCFSRYYVTFPLDSIPPGKVVLSATLTMHQFGNAEPLLAEPSRIQVLTVAEDWSEATITWNNAPPAVENIDSRRVDPLLWSEPVWPGVPRVWNVSRAVHQALAANQPLRLALYSADGAYHSGKYFSSSDAADWNAEARPTLHVLWGDVFSGEVQRTYLPLMTSR